MTQQHRTPLRVVAQRRARTRLVNEHKEEYDRLYREEVTKLKEAQDVATETVVAEPTTA